MRRRAAGCALPGPRSCCTSGSTTARSARARQRAVVPLLQYSSTSSTVVLSTTQSCSSTVLYVVQYYTPPLLLYVLLAAVRRDGYCSSLQEYSSSISSARYALRTSKYNFFLNHLPDHSNTTLLIMDDLPPPRRASVHVTHGARRHKLVL